MPVNNFFVSLQKAFCGLILVLAFGSCSDPNSSALAPPETERQSVTETLFGIPVSDPYRWLENSDNEEVKAWARAQDSFAREVLTGNGQNLEQIRANVAEDSFAPTMGLPIRRGDFLYYMLVDRDFSNPALVRKKVDEETFEVLVDPGAEFVIRDFRPDGEGKFLAYALQNKTTGERTWYFRNLETGQDFPLTLSGGGINGNPWLKDGETFVFYRSPDREKDQPARVCSVDIREAANPTLLFANENSPEAGTYPDITENGKLLILSVFEKSNANRIFVKNLEKPDAEPVELFAGQEGLHTYVGHSGGTFYFLTTFQSPKGRIVGISLENDDRFDQKTLVAEGDNALTQAYFFGGKFLGVYLEDGFQIVKIFGPDGSFKATLNPPKGLVWTDYPVNWAPFSGTRGDKAYFSSIALIGAGIYEIDLAEVSMTQVFSRGRPTPEDRFAVKQVFFDSHDGTKVPMTLIHGRDLGRTGNAPVLINVYGAYGFTFVPFFNPMVRDFLEAGGIYAVPNIRGGGIYGQEWYEGGRGDNKINSALDTVFAAKWLIDSNFTRPARLAVMGNSAGSIPAAVAAITNPDLFGALLLEVPLADMVRYKNWTQSWNSEFSDTETPEGLAASLKVSPYHLLEGKKSLPRAMITAGDLDRVANVSHAYKLTAALQHAQTGDGVPLLHIDWGTGHGANKTTQQRVDTWAFELAFLYEALDMPAP